MNRIEELISKLKEQFEHNADPSELLITTQKIQLELLRMSSAQAKPFNSVNVSVVMPPVVRVSTGEVPAENETEEVLDRFIEKNGSQSNGHKQETKGWLFDPMTEIPTLSHQQNGKELNEVIGSRESSLNDKLKEEVTEIGHVLTGSPIRDLRRAIGVNDRYVFINELFRGDEVMYERSIKTINGFRIFAEAEYWIEREMKVKLGWDETREITKHFYQLVKRRFS